MATPQWIKNLGGHAGELYVAAELSKRGIPNSLLPENFSDDDILAGKKDGTDVIFIQVKSCHPDRSKSFILSDAAEKWIRAGENKFVVFVWLGSLKDNEPPQYWLAKKKDVGKACVSHSAHGKDNWERRFYPKDLDPSWKNNWELFRKYMVDDLIRKEKIKLHKAIEQVLKKIGRPMTTREIAEKINYGGLYRKKDGSPVTDYQIHGRTKNYPHMFCRTGSMVSLKSEDHVI